MHNHNHKPAWHHHHHHHHRQRLLCTCFHSQALIKCFHLTSISLVALSQNRIGAWQSPGDRWLLGAAAARCWPCALLVGSLPCKCKLGGGGLLWYCTELEITCLQCSISMCKNVSSSIIDSLIGSQGQGVECSVSQRVAVHTGSGGTTPPDACWVNQNQQSSGSCVHCA